MFITRLAGINIEIGSLCFIMAALVSKLHLCKDEQTLSHNCKMHERKCFSQKKSYDREKICQGA